MRPDAPVISPEWPKWNFPVRRPNLDDVALDLVVFCLRRRGAVSETRKLAAILVADVVGYSRLAGADEERTLARLRALRSDLIDPSIALHHGRIVKRTGDGSIIEFRSVVDAVRCAIEVQSGMVERRAAPSRGVGGSSYQSNRSRAQLP
jgi:class 3 adenylate cyclase